jgi:hypothetical protein
MVLALEKLGWLERRYRSLATVFSVICGRHV